MISSETHTLTTSAGGIASQQTGHVNGFIREIRYTKDDFDATVDVSVIGANSGREYWVEANVAASKSVRPTAPASTTAGVASVLTEHLLAIDEPLVISVAQGGNAKSGDFEVLVEGNLY